MLEGVLVTSEADDQAFLRRRGLLPGQVATPDETDRIRARYGRDEYVKPDIWNMMHVDRRLQDAFTVLHRLPGRIGPKQHGSAMPAYTHEWGDYLAQAEGEREAKRARNRVEYRHRGASLPEVTAMDQALGWSGRYLSADPDAAKCAQLAGLWKALELDFDRRVSKAGYKRRTFFWHRKRGLMTIVMGLSRDRVVVS